MGIAMSSFMEQVRPLAEGMQDYVDDEKNSHRSGFEEILDRWCEDIQDVVVEAEQICKSVEDATRFLEASMSCMRNKLLWFELVANGMMVAVGLACLLRDLQEPSASPSLQGSSTVATLRRPSLSTTISSSSFGYCIP